MLEHPVVYVGTRLDNLFSENPTSDVVQCAASNAAGTFDVPDNQQERPFWK